MERSDNGTFITFEGIDGAGKSTHIRFLAKVLQENGLDVVHVREPGGTSIGEQLRGIVLDPRNSEISPRTELLIYEAARSQLMHETIIPALQSGDVVLCDRFIDSTIAYQGYGRDLSLNFINQANSFATDGIVPDLTFFMGCSYRGKESDRVDSRDTKDRIEREDLYFKERIRKGFSDLIANEPDRFVCIDTTGKHSETARMIFSSLDPFFPWLNDGSCNLEPILEEFDKEHAH